jgi:transposase-like protein
MNSHKHARLTYARRLEMVRQMTFEGLSFAGAAAVHGVTPPTARKWLGRFLAGGESALEDASSRPTRSPRSIDPGKALLIERFIQSALREWAYGWTYQNSAHRSTALASWQHHYNWHRPHSGIGGAAPMSRLGSSANNVLTVHT